MKKKHNIAAKQGIAKKQYKQYNINKKKKASDKTRRSGEYVMASGWCNNFGKQMTPGH